MFTQPPDVAAHRAKPPPGRPGPTIHMADSTNDDWFAETVEAIREASDADTMLGLAKADPLLTLAVLENPSFPSDRFPELVDLALEEFGDAIARDPRCPPEVLEQLANSQYPHVRQAVQANPTATDLARQWVSDLAIEPPDDAPYVFHDVVDVEPLLIDPDPRQGARYLELIDGEDDIATEYAIERELLEEPILPPFVLERIFDSVTQRLKKAKELNVEDLYIADPLVIHQFDEIKRVRVDMLNRIVRHRSVTVPLLRKIAKANYTATAPALARNPSTPLPTLKNLLKIATTGFHTEPNEKRDYDLLRALADHRGKQAKELHKALRALDDPHVDTVLAANPKVRQMMLDRLRDEKLALLAPQLASNESLDQRELRGIFERYPAVDVAREIAGNPSCDEDLLTSLAASPDEATLVALAENPSSPTRVLRYLFRRSRSEAVRIACARNPSLPADVTRRVLLDPVLRPVIATNAGLMGDVIEHLITSDDLATRLALAHNRKTTAAQLQALVAAHPPTLIPLGGDPTLQAALHDFERAVIVHPNVSTDTLSYLTDHGLQRRAARLAWLARIHDRARR